MIRVKVDQLVEGLLRDHETIIEALKVLFKALEGDRVDMGDVKLLLDFIEVFIDKCHHSKEEYILFPGMMRRGVPFEAGPLYVMTCEHGVGRYIYRLAQEAFRRWEMGDSSARSEFVDYARMYADHIAQHIEKENRVLFPMASSMGDLESTRDAEEIEREFGHEKWVSFIEKLKVKYGP